MAYLIFAAIADVHANRWALEAVLEDIERRGQPGRLALRQQRPC